MPITAADLERQREYIYAELSEKLPTCNFSLVMPVHQVSAAFNVGITPGTNIGFCHGFNDYWAKSLLTDESFSQKNNTNAFMPLTPDIQARQQKRLFTYRYNLLTNNSARLFTTQQQLLDYFAFNLIKSNLSTSNMLVLGLAKPPTYTSITRFMHRWHEVRMHMDHEGYLHLFDANIGWFKSNRANPELHELKLLLEIIFNILQYDEYKVCALFKAHTLKYQ